MLQAKHRRVLWLLLLIWLQLLHSRLLEKLMDASFRSLQLGSAPGDDLRTLLSCFWLAGALCMVLWQFGSYQRFRRKELESMKPVEESWMRSACEQAALEAGCEAVPPLYQSSSVSTPLVLGFAAPVMLVPEGEYTWAELRMVFLHECTHIRKKDLWYKLIFTAAACILWFQPLLYLLKAAAYRDLEIACDQNVVEGKPEADRKAYADFLLESLRKGRNRELPYSAYFYNSKSVMKARLAVVEDTRVRSGIPGASVCAALAVLTVLIFADRVNEVRQALWNPYAAEPPQNLYEDSELPECRARNGEGAAEVTWNDGTDWMEVPAALEALTARGDQMDGALTGLQDKSYTVSEEMTAFAYGGSAEVPVTVTWTKDKGANWTTSVVTHEYNSVRCLFLSFPDAEHGFLVLTAGRTMWQEGDVLFATKDGGYTWTEVERESAPGYEGVHSLTIGAEFVTPEVGFVAIRSSQEPELYRTEDGGVNWELCAFPESGAENEEFYTMAYPPEQKEDRLCVYLGMEEYSELGGTRLRYESEDLGKTWSYTGEVRRQ